MAIKIMLGLVGSATLFHVLILIRLIPYEIAWGGRLRTLEEMYVFEGLSIAINLFLGFILPIRGSHCPLVYFSKASEHCFMDLLLPFYPKYSRQCFCTDADGEIFRIYHAFCSCAFVVHLTKRKILALKDNGIRMCHWSVIWSKIDCPNRFSYCLLK